MITVANIREPKEGRDQGGTIGLRLLWTRQPLGSAARVEVGEPVSDHRQRQARGRARKSIGRTSRASPI